MPELIDELSAYPLVLGALGRLAAAGLLDRPAPASDPVAVASQALLVEVGMLHADPFGPSDGLRAAMPPGMPLAAANTFVREVLGSAVRFAEGGPPGWAESDPGLIRSRGATSGNIVVGHLLPLVLAAMPDVIERLNMPGSAFLDVGVGAAGIAIRMCQQYPQLSVVGLDVSEFALAVARHDVAAAGLDGRIEIRAQSVAALADVAAFDLLWLPQPFIPLDTLTQALPRLRAAARPNAVLIMPLATHDETGLVGLANDLRNLMAGGGTLRPTPAADLLRTAGFTDVTPVEVPSGSIVYGRAA
jgi:hypothetical protein